MTSYPRPFSVMRDWGYRTTRGLRLTSWVIRVGRVWAEDSATLQRSGSWCSDLVHDVSETDHLDGVTVALFNRGRGVLGLSETARANIGLKIPIQITARPPGDKNSIQSSMDLSRIPSF